MFVKPKLKCDDCIKPIARRLALFQANDEYECYAESYVKCFWSMCDTHRSIESLAVPSDARVITQQPRRDLPFTPPIMSKDVLIEIRS